MVLLRQHVTLTYDPAPGDITVVPGGSSNRAILSADPQLIDIFNQPAPPLPTSQIDQLVGPYQTTAEAAATGGRFATQDTKQTTFGNIHAGNSLGALNDNFYDRVMAWHVYSLRGAGAIWATRASSLAAAYIAPISQNNTQAPRNSFQEGMALHQLVNGIDPTINTQMGFQANNLQIFTPALMGTPGYRYAEGRILARVGVAQLMMWFLGDTSQNWGSLADQYVDVAINTQNPDGSYTWQVQDGNDPRVDADSNFMHGIIGTWLAKHVRCRLAGVWPANIRNWFLLSADYFRTQWQPNERGFSYWNVGAVAGRPDANQLIAGTMAIAHYLGHPQAGAWGQEAYDGGVDLAYYDGFKQYNQQYFDSFNFHFYRNNIL